MNQPGIERIGELLRPLVEEYNKAFEVSADGHITELDPKSFATVKEGGPDADVVEKDLFTCGEGYCWRTYPRCPDGVTTGICVPRDGGGTWVNYVYRNPDGTFSCSSMKLTCK
jgi:hypothetical protein